VRAAGMWRSIMLERERVSERDRESEREREREREISTWDVVSKLPKAI
jgi:hypothetical protein